MTAGLAVEAIGLFVAIWARRHLGRNWSGEITIKVDHQLVRSGPYKLLRHPIYTGLLAMYAGIAIVTGEWLGMVGFAMAVFAYWRKIRLEEANLKVAFGAEYDAYRRETWALGPGCFSRAAMERGWRIRYGNSPPVPFRRRPRGLGPRYYILRPERKRHFFVGI